MSHVWDGGVRQGHPGVQGRDARGYGVLMDARDNTHRARGCPWEGTSRCGDPHVGAPGLWGIHTHSGSAEEYTQGAVNPGRHLDAGEGLQGHRSLGMIPGSEAKSRGTFPTHQRPFWAGPGGG